MKTNAVRSRNSWLRYWYVWASSRITGWTQSASLKTGTNVSWDRLIRSGPMRHRWAGNGSRVCPAVFSFIGQVRPRVISFLYYVTGACQWVSFVRNPQGSNYYWVFLNISSGLSEIIITWAESQRVSQVKNLVVAGFCYFKVWMSRFSLPELGTNWMIHHLIKPLLL